MLPIISFEGQTKDTKIQDTDDVVGNRNMGGMAKRNTLPMARRVRWKDLEKEKQSKDTREMVVLF